MHQVRLAVHSGFTRLVFDAEGKRPLAVGPATEEGINIEFTQPGPDSLAKRKLNFAHSALTGIELRQTDSASEIVISFRNRGTTVKHQFLTSDPPASGRYRLILDFSPPTVPVPVERKPAEEKAPPEPAATRKSAPTPAQGTDLLRNYLQPPPAALNETIPDAPPNPKGKKSKAASAEASQSHKAKAKTDSGLPAQPTRSQEPAPPDTEAVAAFYDSADAFFLEHEKSLSQNAPEAVSKYVAALTAGPKSSRAPVALYRCGLSYLAVVNLNRAEKSFRDVLSTWPDHPVAPKCWLGLGQIYSKRNSLIEAIDAFRSALKSPMEKSDRALALYQLGAAFFSAGIFKEAEEMLDQAMNDDPFLYIRDPNLFKTLGEVSFALGKFDKSRDYLLRYLNIYPDSTGKDLILAKIAESFLNEGDGTTANRLYNYIQRDFPDSEGSIVSSIRQAELMEKGGGKGVEGAMNIYAELSQKNPPPALRNMVNLKLATWEYKRENYEKSIDYIEQIMRGKPDSPAVNEAGALRDMVLAGWVKKAFSDKNYPFVIQTYEKYLPLYKFMQSQETDLMAADSFAMLRLYPAAFEIYERVVSTAKKKNEDWLMKAAQYALLAGDSDKAAQYCKQIQSEAFENRKAEVLAGIYYRQGKFADAVKSFSKVFQKDKEYQDVSFDSLFSYVRSLVELKKHEEALAVIEKAVPRMGKESEEDRMHICLLTSRCQQEIKQPEQAIQSLEAALALTSDEEQTNLINYEISKLYLVLGQPDKASQKLNAILGTSFSFWKTAAQQQLDSIYMSKQQQGEPASTKQ